MVKPMLIHPKLRFAFVALVVTLAFMTAAAILGLTHVEC